MEVSLMVLGKSALKMAVAAAITFLITQQLHWDYPFYAVIASIIVMTTTYGSTLTLGIQRVIGTAIGAVGGAFFTIVLGTNFWSVLSSVFFTTLLASWKFQEASKMAGYVSTIVILSHNQSPWLYAWSRFWETLLGIGVALFVNHFLFPSRAGEELRRCLAKTLVELEEFYGLVVDSAFTGQYDRPKVEALKSQIIASFQKGRSLWKEVRQGQSGEPPQQQVNEAWEFLIHRIWEHILTMEHTILARQQDRYWQMLVQPLTQLAQETSTALLQLATAVKTQVSDLPLPDLDSALTKTTEQFNSLNSLREDKHFLDDLLRFFTFFYTMEEVGRKVQQMGSQLTAMTASNTTRLRKLPPC